MIVRDLSGDPGPPAGLDLLGNPLMRHAEETAMNHATVRNLLACSLLCSLLAMIGCSGDESTQVDSANATSDSSSTCGLSIFDSSTYDPFATTGSGTLLFQGKTTQLKEMTCQTLRNTQGEVLGYAAVLADQTPEPLIEAIVDLDLEYDDFVGDSTYSEIYVQTLEPGENLFEDVRTYTEVTLTLSQGGKRGVAVSEDGAFRLEYSCDPKDDTSAETSEPLGELKPGMAEIVRKKDGLVMRFNGLVCTGSGGFSSDVSVTAPTQGWDTIDTYYLNFDVAKPDDTNREANISGTYYDIVDFTSEGVEIDFDCSGGTIRAKPGYSVDYTGKFRCPLN